MPKQPDISHWVKDEFVLKCESCNVAFSVTVRRHHCRCCGQVFCGECTSKQTFLPKLGYGNKKKQRVCEHCYTKTSVQREADAAAKNKPHTAGGASAEDALQLEIAESLKRLYTAGIKPLEVQFRFGEFHSPTLVDADFVAKPMVLLMGQYSVGKTSFIKYLLERDFPGMRIGPEPTTDRFMIVTKSETGQDGTVPGNALAVRADRPFQSLQTYGSAFLSKLECSEVGVRGAEGDILNSISFVDTPGVLSGEKQRIGRSYDFPGVIEWFAGRCDRILLLFDAHKLDISDEFQQAINSLRGHDEKIRVVLNKSDSVDAQQLMKVHGALMWSLGKVIRTPEVVRVYVGSFWDEKMQHVEFEQLFRREHADLVNDLRSLPGSSVIRKVNEVVKRARAARTHALLIDHLRNKLPFFGKEAALVKMVSNIKDEYKVISRKHSVPMGDFPDPQDFRRSLKVLCNNDLSDFPSLNFRMISELSDILQSYIPRLLSHHSQSLKGVASGKTNPFHPPKPPSDDAATTATVTTDAVEVDEAGVDPEWGLPNDEFTQAVEKFEQIALKLGNGKVVGRRLKLEDLLAGLKKTGLSPVLLKKAWDLADVDKDDALDVAEYALVLHYIKMAKAGKELPANLPARMVPPSKR